MGEREEGDGEGVDGAVCEVMKLDEQTFSKGAGHDPTRFLLRLQQEDKRIVERRKKDAKTLPLIPVAEVIFCSSPFMLSPFFTLF